MNILLRPVVKISENDLSTGLKALNWSGTLAQIMVVLTSGAFLTAFALELGASNKTIGLIAAIAPLSQIIQVPSIYLINKLEFRKIITVLTIFSSRILWVPLAFLPWIVSESFRVPLFLILLVFMNCLGAVSNCSWNSWIRDLVPEKLRSSYFAKRLAIMTGAGAAVSLVVGLFINKLDLLFSAQINVYSLIFLVAAGMGIAGTFALLFVPEPEMEKQKIEGLFSTLAEPFKDPRFKPLIIFLATWNFAVNLAAPFFAVYMLKKIGLNIAWVIVLGVISQIVNILFFSIWGRLSDRYSNKSVLSVSGTLFIVSILMWTFTTMPGPYLLTIPLLILIHALAGMSTAGVALCSSNIALKFAPRGKATSYLAVNSLVSGIAATVAPVIAGASVDMLKSKQLKLTFTWISEKKSFHLPAMDLTGLDFLFLAAFVLGLYSLHRLLAVKEEGEAKDKVVIQELLTEMRQGVRNISTAAGMKYLFAVPIMGTGRKIDSGRAGK